MTTIVATATRQGAWWAVEVPVGGEVHFTQGRTLAGALEMARDVVAIVAEGMGDRELLQAEVTLETRGELLAPVETARQAQVVADIARADAKAAQAAAVSSLLGQGLTMQDVATLMGVTKGRVSQIAHAA